MKLAWKQKTITMFSNNPQKASSGAELAKAPQFIEYLVAIQSLAALPNEHYRIFYQAPLEKFLAIYQPLPIETIQLKLSNVINALKLRRSHNLPLGVTPEDVREKKDIWTYTVFVAALLYKLPDIANYIILCKKTGSSKSYQQWNPYLDEITSGYDYIIKSHSKNDNNSLMSSTLFPILFNQQCITWLYSEQDAFRCMLELVLSSNPESVLGQLMTNSHSQSSQKSHIGHDLYFLLIEIVKGNIDRSDKVNNYISLTHEGYAIAIPDIFNYYGAMKKEDAKVIEQCFYSLNKHKPSNYKVTFPNIGKKEAVLLTELEESL